MLLDKLRTIKARTHTSTFAGTTLESTHSSPESTDSTTDFMIVGRLPILNMFDIYMPIQMADENRLSIAVPTAIRSSGYGPLAINFMCRPTRGFARGLHRDDVLCAYGTESLTWPLGSCKISRCMEFVASKSWYYSRLN